MDANGSPEYALTWKHWDMPSGPPICALRASARRTSDSGYTGWPTPTQRDHKDGASTLENTPVNALLGRMVSLAGWGTPRSMGLGQGSARPKEADFKKGRLECQALGVMPFGSPASTEKRGALNPAFSRWLMGFPPEWDACAPTATPSSRKSRPRSSLPALR